MDVGELKRKMEPLPDNMAVTVSLTVEDDADTRFWVCEALSPGQGNECVLTARPDCYEELEEVLAEVVAWWANDEAQWEEQQRRKRAAMLRLHDPDNN